MLYPPPTHFFLLLLPQQILSYWDHKNIDNFEGSLLLRITLSRKNFPLSSSNIVQSIFSFKYLHSTKKVLPCICISPIACHLGYWPGNIKRSTVGFIPELRSSLKESILQYSAMIKITSYSGFFMPMQIFPFTMDCNTIYLCIFPQTN